MMEHARCQQRKQHARNVRRRVCRARAEQRVRVPAAQEDTLRPASKGDLPPTSQLVRIPQKNYYAQDDWRVAVKQLTPLDEFAYQCRVEGTLPKELDGTLFRNGPGRYERGGAKYAHFLDGDGLIVSFDLQPSEQTAFARAKFVRTAEYVEESREEKVLYRGTFGTRKDGISTFDLRTKNLANTNVMFHAGKLHALYEAGVPYKLDPHTLDTLGKDSLNGVLQRTEGLFVTLQNDLLNQSVGLGAWAFTAHPHIDSHTGHMVGWAWQSCAGSSISVQFAQIDEEGNPVVLQPYLLENCMAAPHDFGVTKQHYVMIQNRLDLQIAPYVLGMKSAANALVSRPDLPVLVHVIPREGATSDCEKSIVLEGPRESFEIHVCFAHDGAPIDCEQPDDADDHQSLVTIYTAGWDKLAPGSFLSEWGAEGDVAPDFNRIPRTVLWRYVVDTNTGSVTRTLAPGCEGICIDHPHATPRFEGHRSCRYVWSTVTNEVSTSGPPRGYVRLDLLTGERETWYAPSGRLFVEEPVIVEKDSAKGNECDMGEVWLLGMCTDVEDDGRSSLLILDGARLADGPVCRVRLEHHVTHGLHGCFASGFHSTASD
ncbi:carotenoid oxygenase [Pseudoscourfieldia marina]